MREGENMELSQKLLCFLFLASAGSGVLLGLIYDLMRMPMLLAGLSPECLPKQEKASPSPWQYNVGRVVLFFLDLLFAVVCGVTLVLLLYFINDGQIRMLAPVGVACGFFVYMVTVGRVIRLLIRIISQSIRWLLGLILRPVVKLSGFLARWIGKGVKAWMITPMQRAILVCRNKRRLMKETKGLAEIGVGDMAQGTEKSKEEK